MIRGPVKAGDILTANLPNPNREKLSAELHPHGRSRSHRVSPSKILSANPGYARRERLTELKSEMLYFREMFHFRELKISDFFSKFCCNGLRLASSAGVCRFMHYVLRLPSHLSLLACE